MREGASRKGLVFLFLSNIIGLMTENEIAEVVVNKSYEIHTSLGPGLLESVYQRVLSYELRTEGLDVRTEVPIPVIWKNHKIDEGYKADLIINDLVLIELKSVENLKPVHGKQTLTYLKLTKLKLGLLINFGAPTIKEGLKRVVHQL